MEGGGGLALLRDREMEASVSMRERSGAVSGDTASSNNPAGNVHHKFRFYWAIWAIAKKKELKWRMIPVQVAFSLVNKESIQLLKHKTTNDQTYLIIKRRAEQTYGHWLTASM